MKLNEIDLKLIEELQRNCRQSFRVLSKKTGLSRWAITNRIRELEEQGIIRSYTILVDHTRLGYVYQVIFWLKTDPQRLDAIMTQVSQLDAIHWTSLILGDFDLHLIALFRDREELIEFLFNKIKKIDGILSIKSDLVVSHYFLGTPVERKATGDASPTRLDTQIIEHLRENSRDTYDALARKINASPQTIRNHIRRMIEHGIIKAFTADIDTWKIGYKLTAYIFLQIDPPKFQQALAQVCAFREAVWVAEPSITGNLTFSGEFHDRAELHDFIRTKLDKLPGVQRISTYHVLKVIAKHYV